MQANQAESTRFPKPLDFADASVLVVVVNRPSDLQRAIAEGWYRIPLDRAPGRVAAEYLAFYQTAAFTPEERWLVRWMAPVRGYFLAARRDLIPEEPDHPRAGEQYYKIELGALVALPHPIPSRRLRRITFIPTTLGRLQSAEEINDLWVKSTAQERLWEAVKQAGLEAECDYPLQDDLPQYVADLALFCRAGRIAVLIREALREKGQVAESRAGSEEYLGQAGVWILQRVEDAEMEGDPTGFATKLASLVADLGGLEEPIDERSLCA